MLPIATRRVEKFNHGIFDLAMMIRCERSPCYSRQHRDEDHNFRDHQQNAAASTTLAILLVCSQPGGSPDVTVAKSFLYRIQPSRLTGSSCQACQLATGTFCGPFQC